MDDLDFGYHLAVSNNLHLGLNDETTRYFQQQAVEMHCLTVHDALTHERSEAIQFASLTSCRPAKHHLLYGVGRRLGMMWAAYRSLLAIAPVGRIEALDIKENQDSSRDLNAIYIQIMGAMDNYAWALKYEILDKEGERIADKHVGLFTGKMAALSPLTDLQSVLDPYRAWVTELTKRRHPAVHRIPLSVVPSVLSSSEDQQLYENRMAQYWIFIQQRDLGEAQKILNTINKMGSFPHAFVHDPDEAPVPLYPTVPQDIANFLKVSRIVREFAASKITGAVK